MQKNTMTENYRKPLEIEEKKAIRNYKKAP